MAQIKLGPQIRLVKPTRVSLLDLIQEIIPTTALY